MDSVLTIGEVSRRSGVASSALRFYEERGLISSVRAGSGHRRYPRSVLRRIAFIVFAQRVGLALEEIAAELAKLPTDRIPARQDWARLSGAWTKRIDQRIAELQRLKAGLTQCIGCGCLSIDSRSRSNVRLPNRKLTPVTICRELRHSGQIIRSERRGDRSWGTDWFSDARLDDLASRFKCPQRPPCHHLPRI